MSHCRKRVVRKRETKKTKMIIKGPQHQDIAEYCSLLSSSILIFVTPSMLNSSPSKIKPSSSLNPKLIS